MTEKIFLPDELSDGPLCGSRGRGWGVDKVDTNNLKTNCAVRVGTSRSGVISILDAISRLNIFLTLFNFTLETSQN